MKSVCAVTVGRSDWSILSPILHAINLDEDINLSLVVAGSHLSSEYGYTVELITKEGFQIYDYVDMLLSSDTPDGAAKTMGLGVIGFAQSYRRLNPDLILLVGDRLEAHAAASAALPFRIPVAHIHGGEVTHGAFDDSLRHSITKLSHLHFVTTLEHKKRVIQLGEESWRIHTTGAPSLDNLKSIKFMNLRELSMALGIPETKPPLLVTYHPVTLENDDTGYQIAELLAALDESRGPIIFTQSNSDPKTRDITEKIVNYVQRNDNAYYFPNLGTRTYFSLMALARAMVGNSSSGIIEAGSFKLPVINIGNRQMGRTKGKNVVDVGYDRSEISEGIRTGTSVGFKRSLSDMLNPYGDGDASKRIVEIIKTTDNYSELVKKRFTDLDFNR